MIGMDTKQGCLVLENGMIFRGIRLGSEQPVTAEIVFSTKKIDYVIVGGQRYEPIRTEGGAAFLVPVAATRSCSTTVVRT